MSKIWSPAEEAKRLAARFEGLNKAKFARTHNVPGGPSMLNQQITGHRPLNLAAATAYANGFGVPLAEISPRLAKEVQDAMAGNPAAPSTPPRQEINLDDNPDFPSIKRVNFTLSAGASGFSVDFVEDFDDPIVFNRKWFEARGYRPERLFAVRVKNGSMEPYLWAGDTVVVNTDDTTPADGKPFAVNYEGEMVIKRISRDAGQWWLTSDNPDKTRYPRKLCGEGVFLIGRVVHKQSEHV